MRQFPDKCRQHSAMTARRGRLPLLLLLLTLQLLLTHCNCRFNWLWRNWILSPAVDRPTDTCERNWLLLSKLPVQIQVKATTYILCKDPPMEPHHLWWCMHREWSEISVAAATVHAAMMRHKRIDAVNWINDKPLCQVSGIFTASKFSGVQFQTGLSVGYTKTY